jgi:hypothetical protein
MWWTELSTEENKMMKDLKEEWVYDSGPSKVEDNRTTVECGDDMEGWISGAKAYGGPQYELTGENYAQIESNLLEYKDMVWAEDEKTEHSPLKLYHEPENQMLAEFTGDKHFVMYNDEGDLLVDFNLSDHSMIFGDKYTPDESAKVFWETIGKVEVDNPTVVEQEYFDTVHDEAGNLIATQNTEDSQFVFSAPPGIADDMPSSYFDSGIEGWAKEENKQYESFDKAIEGLIDG